MKAEAGERGQEQVHQCVICATGSGQRVLLPGERNGVPIWVCVRCLPRLIHADDGEDQGACAHRGGG